VSDPAKKILGILSCNYSGSHFLSLMLGSHSQMAHIGELKNMIKPHKPPCHICGDSADCSIFHDLHGQPREDLYRILFERFGPETRILVDASKKPTWFKPLVTRCSSSYDFYFIHLVRDPRALLRRWLLTYDTPRAKRQQLIRQCRRAPWELLRYRHDFEQLLLDKWLAANRKIDAFIRQSGRPQLLTTYESVARHSADELGRIMEWVGLPFEPSQIEYWRFDHHGTQKKDYEWIKQDKTSGHFDVRWQTYLSEEQIHKTTSHPGINAYLDECGLQFGPDGLERC